MVKILLALHANPGALRSMNPGTGAEDAGVSSRFFPTHGCLTLNCPWSSFGWYCGAGQPKFQLGKQPN